MDLWVGTSGYSYPEWKGSFYPEDLAAKNMLSYYGTRLLSVEINNTFYRMPKKAVLTTWVEQVPEGFRFAVKASRRITHIKRLKEAADECGFLFGNLEVLGDKLGVVLFQLPPYLKKDLPRLETFLPLIPVGLRVAFEFRHASWYESDAAEMIAAHGAAYVVSDTGDDSGAPLLDHAPFGYLRLRRAEYTDADLQEWSARIRDTSWQDAFVYFKHEEDCAGPQLAERFLNLHGAA